MEVENVVVYDDGILFRYPKKVLVSEHKDVYCGVSEDWELDSTELWVHEFTEMSIMDLIRMGYIVIHIGKEEYEMNIAHVLTSLHTKSGIQERIGKKLKTKTVDSETFAEILFNSYSKVE